MRESEYDYEAATMRRDIVEEIVQAAQKPLPSITDIVEHECSDGVWRGTYALHGGHRTTGNTRLGGYCRVNRDGQMYGSRFPTRQALMQDMVRVQGDENEELRDFLYTLPMDQLEAKHAFWFPIKKDGV